MTKWVRAGITVNTVFIMLVVPTVQSQTLQCRFKSAEWTVNYNMHLCCSTALNHMRDLSTNYDLFKMFPGFFKHYIDWYVFVQSNAAAGGCRDQCVLHRARNEMFTHHAQNGNRCSSAQRRLCSVVSFLRGRLILATSSALHIRPARAGEKHNEQGRSASACT